MKKILSIFIALTLLFTLSGCEKKNSHSHTFHSGWSYDYQSHWHIATCGHYKEVSDKGRHDFDNLKVCKVCNFKLDLDVNSGIDFESKTVKSITKNSETIYLIRGVLFNQLRKEGTVVVYTSNDFVKMDDTGYEVAVNKYNQVVEIGANVSMPEGGFVISASSTSDLALKSTILVGDFALYDDSTVYFYRNRDIERFNTAYMRYFEVMENIEVNETNIEVIDLLVKDLEKLYKGYNANVESDIFDTLDFLYQEETEDLYNHTHQYTPHHGTFPIIPGAVNNDVDYRDYSIYSGTLYVGGFRNQDTIVYYDESCYSDRNIWGYEIAVDRDGFVIDMNTLVELPEGGFIISGHNQGANYIRNNISLGDKIEIREGKLVVKKNFKYSNLNILISLRNEIVSKINEEINNEIPHDYLYIKHIMSKIDTLIEKYHCDGLSIYDIQRFNNACLEIEEYSEIIYSQLLDNNITDTKGIWYYPFQPLENVYYYDDTTKEGVVKTLTEMKKMGINEIFINPFTDLSTSGVIYESNYYETSEIAKGHDYGEYGSDFLSCFISEAHKLGISVTAYTQTFYAHIDMMKNGKEEYYQVNYQGEKIKSSAYEVYYYDICNDELQDIIINWYKELITKYDFDGVEYDIIRYPESNLYNYLTVQSIPDNVTIVDPGYTDYTMNKFMNAYGYTGDLKYLILNNLTVRQNWIDFKEAEINDFVKELSETIKGIDNNIYISAAVMNNYNNAFNVYLQDYVLWANEGYVDGLEVMAYTTDYNTFENIVSGINQLELNVDIRYGIGAKMEESGSLNTFKQLYSIDDYVLFASTYYYRDSRFVKMMSNNHHSGFVSSMNNKQEIINILINDSCDMINNYYEEVDDKHYNELIEALESKDVNDIKEELNKLSNEKMKEYLIKHLDIALK